SDLAANVADLFIPFYAGQWFGCDLWATFGNLAADHGAIRARRLRYRSSREIRGSQSHDQELTISHTKPFSAFEPDEGVPTKRAFAVKLVVVSQAHTCSEQPPPAQVSLQPPRNIGIALDVATQLCGRNFSPGGA